LAQAIPAQTIGALSLSCEGSRPRWGDIQNPPSLRGLAGRAPAFGCAPAGDEASTGGAAAGPAPLRLADN